MRILIVENDPFVTKLWSKWLAHEHEVQIAESVSSALKSIDDSMPDVVLLDLRLNGPTNSGLSVYDYLRGELNRKTPIIFITGLEYSVDLFKRAQQIVEDDIQLGLKTRMVKKPISIHGLSKEVQAIAA